MLNDNEKKLIDGFMREGFRNGFVSDDGMVDFCEDNGIDVNEAFLYVELKGAPQCCYSCENNDMYPDMHPCSQCSRNKKDFFSPARRETD